MAAQGFQGRVVAERAADEELLRVLHFWRAAAGAAGGDAQSPVT
jgi:hypothetical protein